MQDFKMADGSTMGMGHDGTYLEPIERRCGWTIAGKKLVHDEVYILDGLAKATDLNNRVVRICRPPDERDDEPHPGRVLVQFLIGATKTFAKPANLYDITEERRTGLPEVEAHDLMLYEESQKGFLGIDARTGAKVYDTTQPMGYTPMSTPRVHMPKGDVASNLKSLEQIEKEHKEMTEWALSNGLTPPMSMAIPLGGGTAKSFGNMP